MIRRVLNTTEDARRVASLRRALVVFIALFALVGPAATASAAGPATLNARDARSIDLLLDGLGVRYQAAVRAHDAALAAGLRRDVALLGVATGQAPAITPLAKLVAPTRNRLQPWPLVSEAEQAIAATRRGLALPAAEPTPAKPYGDIKSALDRYKNAADPRAAALAALDAETLTRARLLSRLGTSGAALEGSFTSLDGVLASASGTKAQRSKAAKRAKSYVNSTQQSLGDVKIGKGQVVTDAAVIVFREGLEAVLILAAITASLVGARAYMKRPVLIGGVLGIGATAITWVLAQVVIHELGNGGLRMEAITGLLAIIVLLLITNWFFHKVYWSQWITRFNKRRKTIEKWDAKFGFISGQALALGLLGLTSVYREGFETVLFLQNLQVSAGTSACLLGAGIGLGGTLAAGLLTFVAQRKLPYKKLLIATGMMIAVVLAVMIGTTTHVLQGLGWISAHPTGFDLPLWANQWLGLFATWEGIGAQIFAFVFVIGSYVVAREFQVKRPQRRARAAQVAAS